MFSKNLRLLAGVLFLSFPTMVSAQVPEKPVIDTTITEEIKETAIENIPIVSLDDNDGQDGAAQNISGQLGAGRNPFYDAANFHFSPVRFRLRGYDADLTSVYINGVPMENLDNGFTPYGLWGGLNDVLRFRTTTYGMQALPWSFGNIGGATSYDARASRQFKQTKFSYSVSNRNYVHRFMFTKSTGFNKKNWAFSVSGSRRWADEGFNDGTYYDGWSFYVGVDKKINDRHMLSFIAFATPTENGRQGASTQEMMDIAGSNFYNPYWGYQNGKKRNASIARTAQPVGILTHDWKITPKTSLQTAVSYSLGNRSITGLDWYNAADPRPDYYRYLPSWQNDPILRQNVLTALQNDVNKRQINWDALYTANLGNTQTIENVNGITGNNKTGHRAIYILEERVVHTNRLNANTTLNATINSHIDFSGGFTFESQRNHYYKRVEDLLGGEFYVDINQFAERDNSFDPIKVQNDVNIPNRILYEGDHFGYNYNINIQKTSAWGQANVKFNKLNFFVGLSHSYTQYWRVGYAKVGIFQNNSYGESKHLNFYNYGVKGGASYKLLSGNYFFVNGSYETKAPFFENAYVSPRTRDFTQGDLSNQSIGSVEAGYVLNSPKLRFRATGYYTVFRHGLDVINAYSDVLRSFVNYSISNIGKTHTGIELGVDYRLPVKGFSVNGAASIGRYYYDTRQNLAITSDNDATPVKLTDNTIYTENYRVATPQEAYSIGLNYRSPKFWFVNVNFNYFDQMWLGFDPLRHSSLATDNLQGYPDKLAKILQQTKLKNQSTLDAFAGWSWLMNNKFKGLKKRTFMTFSLGVNNILNNRSIISGGYEQLRLSFDPNQAEDIFQPKLFYAYGLNFSANIGLRF
jgi:hypothetical protein